MIPAQARQAQLSALYDQDFCQWAEHTAQLLKNGNFAALDLDNLIEEVEDLSGSQKRALLSNLRVLSNLRPVMPVRAIPDAEERLGQR